MPRKIDILELIFGIALIGVLVYELTK